MQKEVAKAGSSLCLSIFIFMLTAGGCFADDVVVIEDFESESYGEWTADGEAFGERPVEEDMVGALSSRSAMSIEGDGLGSLTSPAFTIQRDAIYFLAGTAEHEVYGLAGDVAVELIVDNEVVRRYAPSRGSSKFHAMFWHTFDVREFKGKEARIRIVDNSNWADIIIDHIIQSDFSASRPVLERTIKVDKPKLNFPVKRGAVRHYIELFVNGKQVRAMDVALAKERVDYWVVTDVSGWLGKEMVIRTCRHPLGNEEILKRISVEEGILDSDNLYNETLRPQFHFSTKRGWINDDNGLVYYDGEYHLFYQHNPYGWDHSRNDYNKTWGHAVSTDLVHWKELPAAIHPGPLGSIYSGSAVVDEKNTTGFQTGKEKPIVAVYTSAGSRNPWSAGKPFSQSIAYSTNRGRTFTKYEGNPVQPNIEYINRDPKAIWYEPDNRWVIVLHFNNRAMAFFTSEDLKNWEYRSEFESRHLIDCPELFQLAVDGDEDTKKWILYGGSGNYHVGDFDGEEYTAETGITRYSYGNAFYASQTFNNIPEEDGRRIQIAWGTIPMPEMPFNQQLLFPVELTLHSTDEGLRMFAYPVKEIEKIHKKEHSWSDVELKPGKEILGNVKGELFDIDAEFKVSEADEFGFLINGFSVKYNVNEKELSCSDMRAPLKPKEGEIRLRILVDRVSIEIFGNDGRIYMPIRAHRRGDKRSVEVFTKGGKTKIDTLKIRELKSIWN